MKGKAKGLGLRSDTETIKDINRAAAKKQRDTIKLNDDYREYCKTSENPITFMEFKSNWYKKRAEANRKKYQKPRKNVIKDDKPLKSKLYSKHQSEYAKLCNADPEFKANNPWQQFHEKRLDEFYNAATSLDISPNDLEKKWSKHKGPQTFFEKMENDAAYRGAVESRKDEEGCYTGTMGQAWGSPKVRYPKK